MKKFEINLFDNINTLNIKSLLIAKKEILKLIKECNNNTTIKTIPQDLSIKETFYPKRTPKDGKVDLYKSSLEIYNKMMLDITGDGSGATATVTVNSSGGVTVVAIAAVPVVS